MPTAIIQSAAPLVAKGKIVIIGIGGPE